MFKIPTESKTLSPILKKVLKDFGGQEALKVGRVLLTADDETTDEKIADLAKIKLNIVRKILYILNDNHLTQFRRVRDKRSGWFIYYWNESFDNLPQVIKERHAIAEEKLSIRLKFESENYFFLCNNGCPNRFTFMDALDYGFHCPICKQGILEEDKNAIKVEHLKNTIIHLRNQ